MAQNNQELIQRWPYKTINQFLDGYAWVQVRDETSPDADINYQLYEHGISYTFFTENDEGLILKKTPSNNWKYYYGNHSLWNDETSNALCIAVDSLLSDFVIKFHENSTDNIIEPMEIYFVENSDKKLQKRQTYCEGSNSFILNIYDNNTYNVNYGKYVSPTTLVKFHRVITPPKFVQDFIIKLKKNVLKPLKTKTNIYVSPNSPSAKYLLKNNQVEILETKDIWIKIRYYGTKTIEGWIKKSAVE
jgi:hypothetical protein